MTTQELIETLGYKNNPAFLAGKRLKEHHGFSFFFTQAQKKKYCNLKGVYALLDSPNKLAGSSITPVVYICEAENESEAEKIHQRVWNQNIVPFLLVVTLKNIRLYSAFEYDHKRSDKERVLEVVRNTKEILSKLSAFRSESIDSGNVWSQQKISTEKRVDRHLLTNLKKLADVLAGSKFNLPIEQAHTLIGKYIYLKYLRDRDILSDEQFEKAEIGADDIFGKNASKDRLYQLEKYLNGFLNGSVFPLPSKNDIQAKHVKKVAGVFKGDDPESGQQFLFEMYDFSYVPIETLSVVYQQFLHAKDQGRNKGAYYTPVHLVNFILDELNTKKPFKDGMKVFDPSCGSGAFLVQCYRRLVESVVRGKRAKLNPTDLRKLLVGHIFGLDADEEACRVAELSLSLTLLDYIEPHDLRTYPTFKLPELHDKNIFYCEGGFFDDDSPWTESIPKHGYDWIVGNPPWKDEYDLDHPYDRNALNWINSNRKQYPVGERQLAEAFAWKTKKLLAEDGQCGLLMPALTLFKKNSKSFRASFFSQIETWCVVNFANLRHCLFEGADNPAAVFFFSGKKDWDKAEHYITNYAPFAIEQSSQLSQKGKPKKLWVVFVNYSIIKKIPQRDIEDGHSMPWKIAMWGTNKDALLFRCLNRRKFPTLDEVAIQSNLSLSEGLQLRVVVANEKNKKGIKKTENVELCNEVRGKDLLLMKKLEGLASIHSFPRDALEKQPENKNIYTRKGRKELPLSVCYPPHIILDESRRFAVYSNNFVIVPPRQIGISAKSKNQETFLKALAVYLKSNIAYYFQFWTAVNIGIERDVFNLEALKKLPVPLNSLSDSELAEWAKLHDEIVVADKLKRESQRDSKTPLFNSRSGTSSLSLNTLLRQLNDKVFTLLGTSKKQQWLIEDILNVRLKLNDGVFDAEEAIKLATKKEMEDFANIFQEELDLFLDHSGKKKVHNVKINYTDNSTIMIVDHLKKPVAEEPKVFKVKDNEIQQIMNELQEKLTEIRSQWMYFTRCLQIHEGRSTYIFKPRQRLYWLKSQALAEADDFIEEKLKKDK